MCLLTVGVTVTNTLIDIYDQCGRQTIPSKKAKFNVIVIGGSVKNDVWSKNSFLNSKHIIGSLPDMINLHQLILALSALLPCLFG